MRKVTVFETEIRLGELARNIFDVERCINSGSEYGGYIADKISRVLIPRETDCVVRMYEGTADTMSELKDRVNQFVEGCGGLRAVFTKSDAREMVFHLEETEERAAEERRSRAEWGAEFGY